MNADPHGIFIGSLDSKESKQLISDLSNAAYAPPGYLIFSRDANLMAQSFDAKRLITRGEPFRIAQQKINYFRLRSLATFTVSENALLAYQTVFVPLSQFQWLDRSGKQMGAVGEPGYHFNPNISPDGTRIAVVRIDPQTQDGEIWIYETLRNNATRFTFQPGLYVNPIWSPDGSRLAYTSQRNAIFYLYQKAASGVGTEEQLLQSDMYTAPGSWSSDGKWIAYDVQDPTGPDDLWILPTSGDRKPFVFLKTSFEEFNGRFSPDAKWIGYISNASGKNEVYVRPSSGSEGQ